MLKPTQSKRRSRKKSGDVTIWLRVLGRRIKELRGDTKQKESWKGLSRNEIPGRETGARSYGVENLLQVLVETGSKNPAESLHEMVKGLDAIQDEEASAAIADFIALLLDKKERRTAINVAT